MVRRSTTGSAVPRDRWRGRARPAGSRRRLLGAIAASAAGLVVVVLTVTALSPLASLSPVGAGAPSQCEDSRDLLATSSALEHGSVAGALIACVDEDHRSLTIHNRTPVVWVLGGQGVDGVVSQTGGVSGLLSSHASRSGRGLLLAPGASASVSAGPGRIAPQPDAEGTRLFLALTAIVGAQDSTQSNRPARAPRSAIRSAALTCALALTRAGYADLLDPAAAQRAAQTAACSTEWRRAQVRALGDGWILPGLSEAMDAPGRREADGAVARAAADWFSAAGGFAWGAVERPRRLP